MPTFSVIIISYNGKDFLRKSLTAALKSVAKPLQIIVSDDGSTDGTEEMVKKEFGNVENIRYVRREKNSGVPAARNFGASLATGDVLIFQDNDILVRPDSYEKLVDFIEKTNNVGMVGAKFIPVGGKKMWWNMGYDPNNLREGVGVIFSLLLNFFPKSNFLKRFSMSFVLNYWNYDKILEVDWVAEGCFALKKEVYDKIGGFDESFFMYYEGSDSCLRARKLGYKNFFLPDAQIDLLDAHAHPKERNEFKRHSRYLFYKKHYFYFKSNPLIFWISDLIRRWLGFN